MMEIQSRESGNSENFHTHRHKEQLLNTSAGTVTCWSSNKKIFAGPESYNSVKRKQPRNAHFSLSFSESLEKKPIRRLFDPFGIIAESFAQYFERERRVEQEYKYGYMEAHEDLNQTMREIVINWLVEIQESLKIKSDTLFLAIKIFDSYLSRKEISREKLQLLAIAAFYIACKYEEVTVPDINICVYAANFLFTPLNIVEMESEILETLDFKINNITAHYFLRLFCSKAACDLDSVAFYLSLMLLENSISAYDSLKYKPSLLSSACYYLSRKLLKYPQAWSDRFTNLTGIREEDLIICAKEILVFSSRLIPAVRKKFKARRYCSVSRLFGAKSAM